MLRQALLLSGISVFALPCGADTLNFRGIAAPTCAFSTPVDGTITLQSDLMTWGTLTPAVINAINTAPATLTVTRASNWFSAPGGVPSTVFDHSVTLTGVNAGSLLGSGAARSGVLTALGVNVVSVSLSATATQPFPTGAYQAQVTVTCSVN